eukprot:m.44750 g.44750  ORF g.44750 m.44750 type:complete len:158 (+) comp47069_c0_seq1:63-536(+)
MLDDSHSLQDAYSGDEDAQEVQSDAPSTHGTDDARVRLVSAYGQKIKKLEALLQQKKTDVATLSRKLDTILTENDRLHQEIKFGPTGEGAEDLHELREQVELLVQENKVLVERQQRSLTLLDAAKEKLAAKTRESSEWERQMRAVRSEQSALLPGEW